MLIARCSTCGADVDLTWRLTMPVGPITCAGCAPATVREPSAVHVEIAEASADGAVVTLETEIEIP